MFLEPNEMNVEAALAYVEAGLSKLYAGKLAAKFAAKFEAYCFKAEAEAAGWKFPMVEERAGPAWAMA